MITDSAQMGSGLAGSCTDPAITAAADGLAVGARQAAADAGLADGARQAAADAGLADGHGGWWWR